MNKKHLLMLSSLILLGSCFSAYEVMSNLNISNTNITENTASGSLIGSITTNGGTAPYKYELTGSDSSGFYLSGDQLYVGFTPVHQGFATGKNTYNIEITSTDNSQPTFAGDVSSIFSTDGRFYNNGYLPSLNALAGIRPDGSIIAVGYDGLGGQRDGIYGPGTPKDTGYVELFSNYWGFAAMKTDGSIRARGQGSYGGSDAPTGTGFIKIASAGEAYAALKNDGSIAVWGDPTVGGSGTGPSGTGFTNIMSTRYAFAALKNDGSIVVWGSGAKGGAGAPAGTGFVKIYGGYQAFAAIKADGSISARGDSTRGGAGGPAGTGYTKICGNNYAFAALKNDGSIAVRGTAGKGGSAGPSGTGFVKIYGNGQAFAAVKVDNSITVRGNASYGGSGAPTGTGYTKILGQGNAYAALKNDGSIATRGWGPYGGSGGPIGTGFTDIYGTYQAYAALKNDGSVTSRGMSNYGGSGAPTGTGFIKILSTSDTFAAIKTDGTISTWGGSASDRQGGVVGTTPSSLGAEYTNNFDINITEIPLTGTIEYSTVAVTSGNVIATLTGLSEPVTITNNSGSNQYTFTGNGTFAFELIDSDGNTGSITATVVNIDKTVHNNNQGGGGGSISKDVCPDGDYSTSYYDRTCGTKQISGSIVTGTNTVISDELISAYQWALEKQVTTMKTMEAARLGDSLTRAEMAKMIANYAVNNLGKVINTGKQANFTDLNDQTNEMKSYITKAYQLGLMGIGSTHFNPNGLVTRAEFATVLARLLYNTVSNGNEAYYTKPLATLSEKGIIKNTNPLLQEARGYVMLMLMRASK